MKRAVTVSASVIAAMLAGCGGKGLVLPTPPGAAAPTIQHVYVSNRGSGTITKYDLQGNQVATSGSFAGLAINGTFGLAYDSANGLLYVAAFTTIRVYDLNGNAQSVSGAFPGLSAAEGIAFDPVNNDLYVADRNNGIKVFDANGNAVTTNADFPGTNAPIDIIFDSTNGFFYVGNDNNGAVTVYDQDGNKQTTTGTFANNAVNNSSCTDGVTFDPANQFIYAAASCAGHIYAYDQQGNAQLTSGTFPGSAGPETIRYVPTNGLIYAVPTDFSMTIKVYDQQGNLHAVSGTWPNVNDPHGLVGTP